MDIGLGVFICYRNYYINIWVESNMQTYALTKAAGATLECKDHSVM